MYGLYTLHRIRSPCMAPRAQQGHSTAKHATHIHAAFCRRSASMPSFGAARCDLTYKPWGRARAPLHLTIEVKAFNVCIASWERAMLYGSSGMLSNCCTFGECALAVWDDTVTCGTHTHSHKREIQAHQISGCVAAEKVCAPVFGVDDMPGIVHAVRMSKVCISDDKHLC